MDTVLITHNTNARNMLNPLIPEFLKWTLPCLNLDTSTDANRGFYLKYNNIMANSVYPDETARDEPSHQDLHCLHRHIFCVCRDEKVNMRKNICSKEAST